MSTQTVATWIHQIERGPDWLFVRVRPPEARTFGCQLAEPVWTAMQYQMLRRVVLELDDTPVLFSELLRELVLLHKRVVANGGLLRLSGVSESNQRVLEICRLAERFPAYADRHAAVMGDALIRA